MVGMRRRPGRSPATANAVSLDGGGSSGPDCEQPPATWSWTKSEDHSRHCSGRWRHRAAGDAPLPGETLRFRLVVAATGRRAPATGHLRPRGRPLATAAADRATTLFVPATGGPFDGATSCRPARRRSVTLVLNEVLRRSRRRAPGGARVGQMRCRSSARRPCCCRCPKAPGTSPPSAGTRRGRLAAARRDQTAAAQPPPVTDHAPGRSVMPPFDGATSAPGVRSRSSSGCGSARPGPATSHSGEPGLHQPCRYCHVLHNAPDEPRPPQATRTSA